MRRNSSKKCLDVCLEKRERDRKLKGFLQNSHSVSVRASRCSRWSPSRLQMMLSKALINPYHCYCLTILNTSHCMFVAGFAMDISRRPC